MVAHRHTVLSEPVIATAFEVAKNRWSIVKVTSASTSPMVSRIMSFDGNEFLGEPRINSDGTRLVVPVQDQHVSIRWVDR